MPSFRRCDAGSSTETENCLTKAITIIALTCLLVVGATAASILGRDSVPTARSEPASPVVQTAVSNKEAKKDRLAVTFALASYEPPQAAVSSEPPRQALASSPPADTETPKIETPAAAAMPAITDCVRSAPMSAMITSAFA